MSKESKESEESMERDEVSAVPPPGDDEVAAGGEAWRRGPLAWMASNPVAANLLMLLFLVGGLLFMGTIKQEVFPEIDLDSPPTPPASGSTGGAW